MDEPQAIAPAAPTPEPTNRIKRWFRDNPWWGFAGFLVGAASLPLAVFLFFEAEPTRSLAYFESPSKTSIYKAGQTSDLTVQLKGREITGDISSLQIAIWSSGHSPVKPDHVLETVKIVLQPKCEVLQAKIVQQTRPLIDFKIDPIEDSKKPIPVSWKILEHNDGAIVQVIYQGDTDVTAKLEGVIEGQSVPTAVGTTKLQRDPNSPWILLAGLSTLGGFLLWVARQMARDWKKVPLVSWLIGLALISPFVALLVLLLRAIPEAGFWLPRPPFDL